MLHQENPTSRLFWTLTTVAAAFAGLSSEPAQAELSLGSPFTDQAVLQRQTPVPVWGTADPASKVTVLFAGQRQSVSADHEGRWTLTLDPLEASKEPRSLTVRGTNQEPLQLEGVVVGEVWICAGQSNMHMPHKGIPEIAALGPRTKNVRHFLVKQTASFTEEARCEGQWVEGPPPSAVALAFASSLEDLAGVPVGIVQTAWGSSSIEGWMPRDMTSELPRFAKTMARFDADAAKRERIEAILGGPAPRPRRDDIFLRTQPNIIYNAMMHPVAPYGCRGIAWYQGEANGKTMASMAAYEETLRAWTLRMRRQWQRDDLCLLAVMLPGYGKIPKTSPVQDPEHPAAHSWAFLRESQLGVRDLPLAHVVNTIDLGDINNIHPKDKLPIGRRLALIAARETLGLEVDAYGPAMTGVESDDKGLVVSFDHADGLRTKDGSAPTGFWIAGEDMEWTPAAAAIKGETVRLSAEGLDDPRFVRYAFAGKPTVNLENGAGLPAVPFRTDHLPR